MEAVKRNFLAVDENLQLQKKANMNSKFKIGQVVCFKNYKRNPTEKEAYFIVIHEASAENELVLYTLTTNRLYPSGTTIIPEFPEEDLRIVDLKTEDVLQEEVVMIKGPTENELTGIIVAYHDDETFLTFSLIDSFLVSNIKVDYHTSENRMMRGMIYVSLYY